MNSKKAMKLGIISRLSLFLLMTVGGVSPSLAITDFQYQSIKQMGTLNGIAVHCRYFDQTRRIKLALIAALPKRRQLGQTYHDSSHDSYLAFIESGADCPGEMEFARQVDEAIEALNRLFFVTTHPVIPASC